MVGLNLVLPLVIIILVGNLLKTRGFYTEYDISVLMKTLFWIILPPLTFRSIYMAGAEVMAQPNLFIAAVICYTLTTSLAFAIASLQRPGERKRIAVSTFASMRSNNIYLGFPVIQIAMGAAGLHYASLFLAVTQIPFQFISTASGELALNGRVSAESMKKVFKKIITNPIIISCVLGVIVGVSGIKMPFVFDKALELMGHAATAVALLALGGSLNISGVQKIAGMVKRTWTDAIIKLVINPFIMYECLKFFPITDELRCVAIVLTAMPNAVNSFVLARGMGMDEKYAADLVAVTTILGIIAIPAWASVAGMI